MSVDWGVLIGAATFLCGMLGIIIKNIVDNATTRTRSLANEVRIKELEHALNGHKFMAVSTFVTNATLKEAMNSFGAAVDRLTDRLDKIIMDKVGPAV